MAFRIPRGDAVRDRRDRPRSGPNIAEADRHSKRVRLSTLAHAIAKREADEQGTTVATVIEDVLVEHASRRGSEEATEEDRGSREGERVARLAGGSSSVARRRAQLLRDRSSDSETGRDGPGRDPR